MSDIGQVDYFILEKLLLEKIEICKVQKTKILNAPQEDWINRHIINAINLRNNLWKQTNRSPYNEELQKSFKKEKEKVQVMIKTCKKKYYHKLFNDTFDQPKKLWQLINNLAMNKIKTSCALPRLMSDSGLITDGTKICNLCNSFFSSIGAELADKISYEYHLDTSNILMYDHNSSHDIILNELKPCDVDELNKIIADLDTNTSTGLDGISPKAIKCIKNIIVEKLAISINKCFKLGIFPDSLKVAKVSPIHKSGSKTDPGNYRPISVLPVISKIFERLLYNRLNNFLTEKKVLIDEQYGFRSKSNTTAAAVDLITKIKTQIDKKNIALCIFVDLKKAFDTVIKKIMNNSIKSNIELNVKINTHNLRNKNKLKLITPRTKYGAKTILFGGAQLFNKLPNELKSCESINVFKNKLKLHIAASTGD
ncbi:hypothetical protein ABMA27_010304 [Loxostege sticticalis]|uniref:Reverse transcriptase domain-containing protein n=1 Tax=Loxostege sticticalis TaxID=481309 RepID=A0ABR3H5B5_LOXSC